MRMYLAIIVILVCAACNRSNPAPQQASPPSNGSDFNKLTDDLIYGSLALSPVGATQAGYHEHNGVQLDEMIDDYSPAGTDAQRKFYSDFQARVNAWNASS